MSMSAVVVDNETFVISGATGEAGNRGQTGVPGDTGPVHVGTLIGYYILSTIEFGYCAWKYSYLLNYLFTYLLL